MAFEIPGLMHTEVAGADLSADQFCFVKFSSGTIAICAAATDIPIGVLQNTPLSGESAELMLDGISKLIAGGTIAAGGQIGTDASGHAVAYVAGTGTTNYVVGTAMQAAVSGDTFAAAIDCIAPHRAS